MLLLFREVCNNKVTILYTVILKTSPFGIRDFIERVSTLEAIELCIFICLEHELQMGAIGPMTELKGTDHRSIGSPITGFCSLLFILEPMIETQIESRFECPLILLIDWKDFVLSGYLPNQTQVSTIIAFECPFYGSLSRGCVVGYILSGMSPVKGFLTGQYDGSPSEIHTEILYHVSIGISRIGKMFTLHV